MLLQKEQIQQTLLTEGCALLSEADFGLTEADRRRILEDYFNDVVLAPEHPGMKPVDRLRARDVVDYQRFEDKIELQESSSIKLTTRPGLAGEHLHGVERDFSRVMALDDISFTRLIRGLLGIIPDAHRSAGGKFHLNLYRTFTNVVSGPHQDGVAYFAVYVLDKTGGGAETTLHDPSDVHRILARVALQPGSLIVVDDQRYLHDVSPLIGGQRDVLVGMVD